MVTECKDEGGAALGAEVRPGARPLPPRVALRPDPSDWSDGELMSLGEAAALFWPRGPISVSSLRNAAKVKQLEVVVIARKILTSKASIAKMSKCAPMPGVGPAVVRNEPPPDPIRRTLGRMCRP
jgi:hypothetical protein